MGRPTVKAVPLCVCRIMLLQVVAASSVGRIIRPAIYTRARARRRDTPSTLPPVASRTGL